MDPALERIRHLFSKKSHRGISGRTWPKEFLGGFVLRVLEQHTLRVRGRVPARSVLHNKTVEIQVSAVILSAQGGLGENPLNRWKSVDGCMDPSSWKGVGGDS